MANEVPNPMTKRIFSLGGFVRIVADSAAGLAAGGLVLLVLLQVGGRLLGRPVPWTEEAVRFLFVWMVFLGLAAGFRTVESARIVVFVSMFRPLFRHLAVPIYVGFSMLFFAIMGWTGWGLVQQQMAMRETAATLAMPMWTIGMILPVASVIAMLAILDSVRNRRDLIALPEPGLPPGEIAHQADVPQTGADAGANTGDVK